MKSSALLAIAACLFLLCSMAVAGSIRPAQHKKNPQAGYINPLQKRSNVATAAPGYSLTVAAPAGVTFERSITVTVSWALSNGVVFDPINDYITAWWEPFKGTYTEFQNVTANSGTFEFTLLNARFPYFFRYYRNNTIMAETAEMVVPEGSYPMQIRTQFVPEFEFNMQVLWASNRTSGQECIMFGTAPNSLDRMVYSKQSQTYTQPQLNEAVMLPPIQIRTTQFANLSARALRCGWGTCYNDFTASELFVDPGYTHTVELFDLVPGTTYYFSVGENGGHMSPVKSFRSRKMRSADETIQLLYVADAGAGFTAGNYAGSASHNAVPIPPLLSPEGAKHVWDAIKADPLLATDDGSIMNGDISYARGWPMVWELYHNETQEIFTGAPVMGAMGNHEYDFAQNPYNYECRGPDSGGEAGIPTAVRFNFKDLSKPWYWIAMGPIAVFILSSEHDITTQSLWLQKELPKVNRTETPWIVAAMHRPMHESTTWVNSRLEEAMQQGYSDVFAKFGVDLVLTGHSHYYERMCSVSADSCATWNFRDVWTEYPNTALVNASCQKLVNSTGKSTVDSCRVQCNNDPTCTGMYLDEKYNCYTLSCTLPLSLQYQQYNSVWSMQRQPGRPPVYVVDGTAGGVHSPNSSPFSPLTEYKDFDKWGYSRLTANKTALVWNHYHIDGSIVDTVTLQPWNAQQ